MGDPSSDQPAQSLRLLPSRSARCQYREAGPRIPTAPFFRYYYVHNPDMPEAQLAQIVDYYFTDQRALHDLLVTKYGAPLLQPASNRECTVVPALEQYPATCVPASDC